MFPIVIAAPDIEDVSVAAFGRSDVAVARGPH